MSRSALLQHMDVCVVSLGVILTHLGAATTNVFNIGETFTGTFSFTFPSVNGINFQGSATLRITGVDGLNVQILGTFTHGQFCNPTRGCRTPGVSQYFLNGTVNGVQLFATPTAWASITDTSFPLQSISGFVSVVGAQTIFSGSFGSGTLRTTLACSAAQGTKTGMLNLLFNLSQRSAISIRVTAGLARMFA